MGILKINDQNQSALSSPLNSCLAERTRNGSGKGNEEAQKKAKAKSKKKVRFQGKDQIIFFTTSETENHHKKPPKVQCLCSPSTHAGSFKCRLHRETSTSRAMKHGQTQHSRFSKNAADNVQNITNALHEIKISG